MFVKRPTHCNHFVMFMLCFFIAILICFGSGFSYAFTSISPKLGERDFTSCTRLSYLLPCAKNDTTVLHVHLAKMAGRTVMYEVIQKLGIMCPWASYTFSDWWSNTTRALSDLAVHAFDGYPCSFSYEMPLPVVERATQHMPNKLYLLMLREPLSWFASAAAMARHTFEDLHTMGCFDNVSACCWDYQDLLTSARYPRVECNRKWYGSNYPMTFLAKSSLEIIRERPNEGLGIADEIEIQMVATTLQRSIFGLVEYFSDSLLIILFQLGFPMLASRHCSHQKIKNKYGRRPDEADLGKVRYGLLKQISSSLRPYEAVYANALTLFFDRVKEVKRMIC